MRACSCSERCCRCCHAPAADAPRRHTNRDIAADEVVQDVSLGWDGKRDRLIALRVLRCYPYFPSNRSPPLLSAPPHNTLLLVLLVTLAAVTRWNGYNAESHAQVMQRFEALEGQRREERQKAIEEKLSTGDSSNPDAHACPRRCRLTPDAGVVPEGLDEDDDKDNIGDATIGQHFDAKNRQSVRNLRIREDTAKFLFNLDPNSAHYDPRTRAMRANPLQGEVTKP